MPTPVVHDPRQNHHGWWGTLAFVDDPKEPKFSIRSLTGDSELQYVFVKVNRESHFVSQGTVVKAEPMGETVDDMLRQLEQGGIQKDVISLIRDDLANLDSTLTPRFYAITAIDDGNTSALARMLNIVTEVCFNNDHWLNCAGNIGAEDIRKGRDLPSLKMTPATPATPASVSPN